MKRLINLLVGAVICAVAPTTLAGKVKPDETGSRLEWSYPALSKGCLLDLANKPAAPGITRGAVAVPIGHQVETKHGVWLCVQAIVRQDEAATGGVWIQAPH